MGVDTINIRKRSVHGSMREVFADIALDATYATGGEALTAGDLNKLMPEFGGGLLATDSGKIESFASELGATGRRLALDRSTGEIVPLSAGAQATGDQSAATVGTLRCRIAYDVGSGVG